MSGEFKPVVKVYGLNKYWNNKEKKYKTTEKYGSDNFHFSSHVALFKNVEKFLDDYIPVDKRENLYYTMSYCGERGRKDFAYLNMFSIDIDKIHHTKDKKEFVYAIFEIYNHLFGVNGEHLCIIDSGNGLHVHLIMNKQYDIDAFNNAKKHYVFLAKLIEMELESRDLKCEIDKSIFDKARILRLPNTLNVKRNTKPKPSLILYMGKYFGEEALFNLEMFSQIIDVPDTEYINKRTLEYDKPDTNAVLSGCDFLKHCKDNQNDISEPQWYAAISILGYLENGNELCHEYSNQYHGYSKSEVDFKLDQALNNAGPRTCANIETLWDGCITCPSYQKQKCPIMIKPDDHIKTEKTGFWNTKFNRDGIPQITSPNYKDLLLKFNQVYGRPVGTKSGNVYFFKDGYYQEICFTKCKSWMLEIMNPEPRISHKREFWDYLQTSNFIDQKVFDEEYKYINFNNGTLNLETKKFLAHSPNIYVRHKLNFEYDKSARNPQFVNFVEDIMCYDKNLYDNLKLFLGYMFSGVPVSKVQKAALFVGGGSNGKSVLSNILCGIIGQNSYTSIALSDFKEAKKVALLEGKLLNVAPETPTSKQITSDVLKKVIAGEETTAKKLYKDEYIFKPFAKHIFSSNKMPRVDEITNAIKRRFLIFPFKKTYSHELKNINVNLTDEILSNKSGVINELFRWADDFCYNDCNFFDNEEMNQMNKKLASSGSVYDYFKEIIEPTDKLMMVRADELYNNFKYWCKDTGINNVPIRKHFITNLESLGESYQIKKIKKAGRPAYVQGYYKVINSEDY